MRLRLRTRFRVGPALLGVLTACLSASDEGGGLRLDVAPIPRLIRGDSAQVHAQLLGEDGVPLPNARFAYSSTDLSVAVVSSDGLVIAVSPGAADIRVQSLGTERTPAVEAKVAVSASVSVDSLRPVVARWGQLLSLYGSGLGPDSGQVVTINDVPVSVVSYQPADSLHPERFGVLQVVAAPPLETGTNDNGASVLVTTARGAAALSTPFTIDSVDVYWPNTLTPADLGTITGRRELTGLAMEAPYWTDWFSFSTAAPGDWIIRPRSDQVVGDVATASVTFFPAGSVEAALQTTPGSAASDLIAYYPGRGSVTGYVTLCGGRGVWRRTFFSPDRFSASFYGFAFFGDTISLRNVPAGRHDLIVNFGGPGGVAPNDPSIPSGRANEWAVVTGFPFGPERAHRYDLVIEPEPGSDLARDAYEPNDFCEDATSPFLTLGSSGFTDSVVDLTFDRPGDTDWFKVTAQTGGLLQIRSAAFLEGDLAPSDADSAVVTGGFYFLEQCTGETVTGVLASDGPDDCALDGVQLQSRGYYLTVRNNSYQPAPYQFVITWSPGAAPGSRIAGGRR